MIFQTNLQKKIYLIKSDYLWQDLFAINTYQKKIIQGIEFADKTMLNMFKSQQEDNDDNIVRLEAPKIESVVNKIEKVAEKQGMDNIILIVPMEVRHMIFMIFSQYINNLTVLAREEVTNYYNFESIAEV